MAVGTAAPEARALLGQSTPSPRCAAPNRPAAPRRAAPHLHATQRLAPPPRKLASFVLLTALYHWEIQYSTLDQPKDPQNIVIMSAVKEEKKPASEVVKKALNGLKASELNVKYYCIKVAVLMFNNT